MTLQIVLNGGLLRKPGTASKRSKTKTRQMQRICRAEIALIPAGGGINHRNLKRSANATVREILSHSPGEVRLPSLRQRPLSTLQRLCDALTQSVLITAAPLSFHCNIRFTVLNCIRDILECQFVRWHKIGRQKRHSLCKTHRECRLFGFA